MKTRLSLAKTLLLLLTAATLLSGCVVVPAHHYYRPVYRPYVEPHPVWHDCRC